MAEVKSGTKPLCILYRPCSIRFACKNDILLYLLSPIDALKPQKSSYFYIHYLIQ